MLRGHGMKPRSERFKLHVQVGILSEDGQNLGSVQDISSTGARIENAAVLPAEGTRLRLGFSFYAYALPVPIHGKVVRHTETGGFAVEFQEVDFRTQILLRALLPKFNDETNDAARPHLDVDVSPLLLEACVKHAEARGVSVTEWVIEQLEQAALGTPGD
jgi:hypothetical protein